MARRNFFLPASVLPGSEILGIDNNWDNDQLSPLFDISYCFIAMLQLVPGKPYGRRCVAGILHLPCGQRRPVDADFSVSPSPQEKCNILPKPGRAERQVLTGPWVCLPALQRPICSGVLVRAIQGD